MTRSRIAARCVVLSIAFLQFGASPAHADWREGFCKEGEGQTVIVDWSATPEAGTPTHLIRCIALEDGADYPERGTSGLSTEDVLLSAGISYTFQGLITDVNGIPTAEGASWHFSTGEPGAWEEGAQWQPEAAVDSFAGITLTPDQTPRVPVLVPQFEESDEPDEGETQPGDDGTQPGDDSSQPGDDGTQPGDDVSQPGNQSEEPTDTPTDDERTGEAPSDPPSSPRESTPRPSDSPVPAPPRPTSAPPAPPTPAAPSPSPTNATASTTEAEEAEEAGEPEETDGPQDSLEAPSPSATPVWGREEHAREPAGTSTDESSRWTTWMVAAFGFTVVGGFGATVGFGVRATASPPVEDE